MHRRSLAALIVAIATCTTACIGGGGTPSTSVTDAPSPTATGPAASAPTTEPIPSDELGTFTCEMPIVEPATIDRAQIVDVRVGAQDGFDRVVFEFQAGTPELTLGLTDPPFTHDASGLPINVDGTRFLRLTMRGGTKQTLENTSSYDGPVDFQPDLTQLVDLVEGGDYEAQSTWYLGLNAEACVRVLLLTDPDRLVIDVEH